MLNLSKQEFADLVRQNPGKSDEEILAIAKQANDQKPKSLVSKAWEWANKPLVELPKPENPYGRFGVELVEGLTSPVGLGLTALSGVGGVAAKLGAGAKALGNVGKATRAANLGVNAAFAGEGLYNVGAGLAEGSLGQAGAGVLQAGLSGLGLAHGVNPRLPRTSNLFEQRTPAASALFDDTALRGIVQGTHANGGQSWNIVDGDMFGKAPRFAVGIYPERELVIKAGQPFDENVLREFAEKNRDLLTHPQNHLGTWRVGKGSKLFNEGDIVLDVGATTPELGAARKAAQTYEQDEIFDLATGNSYKVFKGQRKGVYTTPVEQRLKDLPHDLEMLDLEHRSSRAGLTELDPSYYGQGIQGAEARRKATYPKYWVDRSYATVKGQPYEAKLQGMHTYGLQVPKGRLYDMKGDPENFRAMAQAINKRHGGFEGDSGAIVSLMEQLAAKAGYVGYHANWLEDPAMRSAVSLFTKNPLTPIAQTAAEKAADYKVRQKLAKELLKKPTAPIARAAAGATSIAVGQALPNDPNDPNADKWNAARLGLDALGAAGLGAGALGMARNFPAKWAKVISKLRTEGKANGLKDAQLDTFVRKGLTAKGLTGEKQAKVLALHNTIPLPVFEGIDFDQRQHISKILTKDRVNGGVKLTPWAEARIKKAFTTADDIGTKGWDDIEWFHKFTGGDPDVALKTARMFTSLSPQTNSGDNALQALEAAARYFHLNDLDLNNLTQGNKPRRPNAFGEGLKKAVSRLPLKLKTESLARSMGGLNQGVPVDLWMARAFGHLGDQIPEASQYHLREAIEKLAKAEGMEAFPYMAKLWNGIQKIAYSDPTLNVGKVSDSYKSAIERALGGQVGSLTDPAFRDYIIKNMRGIKDRYLNREVDLPLFQSTHQPSRAIDEWKQLLHAEFEKHPLWSSQWKKEPQFKGHKKPQAA